MKWIYIFFCSFYADDYNEKQITTTVAISKDSVRSYVYDIQYIEWRIIKKVREAKGKDGTLLEALYIVKNNLGEGYYHITPNKIEHYAYFNINGQEFRYHITYTVRGTSTQGADSWIHNRKNSSNKRDD